MSEEKTSASDIECGVLGAILTAGQFDDATKDVERIMGICSRKGVDEKWFRVSQWQKLWEAIKAEWDEHRSVDAMLVAERYGKDGAYWVTQAIEAVPSSSHAEYYIDLLRDKHLYVLVRRLSSGIFRDVEPGNVSQQLEKMAQGIREIQGLAAKADGGLSRVSDWEGQIVEEMKLLSQERFVKKNHKFFIGLPLPWDILNAKYMGLKPGMHIIGALPSQGKTTMGVAISLFWMQRGIKHGFVCIDMQAKELVKRYAALRKQCSLAKMNWGGSPEDVRRFTEGLQSGEKETQGYVDMNMVEMSESYSIERLRDEWYRGVYTHGWKAIIVDYLQLVRDPSVKATATYEKVCAVTQAIKQLYKELNVPIICLVQLSREAGKNYRDSNRRPTLEDLGDSAEIARAASTVAILAGDNNVKEYWKEAPPLKLAYGGIIQEKGTGATTVLKGQPYLAKQLRPVWYYLIKNQQGPTGDVPFVMYPNYFMFRPGDWDAQPETIDFKGKAKSIAFPNFEKLRDDWLYNEGDDILEKSGAMGFRGIDYDKEAKENSDVQHKSKNMVASLPCGTK